MTRLREDVHSPETGIVWPRLVREVPGSSEIDGSVAYGSLCRRAALDDGSRSAYLQTVSLPLPSSRPVGREQTRNRIATVGAQPWNPRFSSISDLPNAATWFYFSLFLTVALFFQFTRLLSIRNLDLLMLFLLVPGFLILQESAALAEAAGSRAGTKPSRWRAAPVASAARLRVAARRLAVLVRAGRVRSRARAPAGGERELNIQGLSWFGIALFIGLTAVALRPTPDQRNRSRWGTARVDRTGAEHRDRRCAAGQTTNGATRRPRRCGSGPSAGWRCCATPRWWSGW